MAFAITNVNLKDLQWTSGITTLTTTAGKAQVQLADKTVVTAQNMGVAGLQYIKGRIKVKSGLTNGNTIAFTVRVDDVVGMTSPELVCTIPAYTFATNDVSLNIDFEGWSDTGFQFVTVTFTNVGGAAVADVILEAF